MITASFRAECQLDVVRFYAAATEAGIPLKMSITPLQLTTGYDVPDVTVQVKTTATFAQVEAVVASLEDGHVMLETLRAYSLAHNSLERN